MATTSDSSPSARELEARAVDAAAALQARASAAAALAGSWWTTSPLAAQGRMAAAAAARMVAGEKIVGAGRTNYITLTD